MIKKNWKVLLITSVVILLPIVAGVILWDQLPDRFPIHWNINGEVDGWCGKPEGVFGLPLLLVALQWLSVLVINADPKRRNQSEKVQALILWLIPVMSILLAAATYSMAMGKSVDMLMLIAVVMGVLFVFIGNYLPKCRQNYTIGIRLPWTLSSEANWNKTHRLAGWVCVIGGILTIGAGFLKLYPLIVGAFLIMAIVPIVYSYVLYRKGV